PRRWMRAPWVDASLWWTIASCIASNSRNCSPFPTFFVQAGDGIRGGHVTGVQTCALPISVVMARPAQGTETHRRGGAEDGRVRRYGGAGEAPDLRQGGGAAARVRVVRGSAVDSGGGHLHPQDSQRGAARGGGRALHPRGAGHGAAPRERGGWGAGGSGAGGGYALVGDGRGAGRVMSAGAQAPADL